MIFKQKKDKIVLLSGLILIILVMLVTFIRPNLKNKKNNRESASQVNSQNSIEEQNYPKISPADVLKKLAGKEDVVIIDIRSSEEYDLEHVLDSINVPLENIAAQKIPVPLNKQLALVTSSTSQSISGVNELKKIGYSNVSVIIGGIDGWKDARGQTVSWGDPTSFVNQSKVSFITSEDLKKKIEEKNDLFIMDVRQSNVFSPHLEGAVNIPVNMLEKRRNEIPINKEIIVYGQTDLEGFNAGVILYDLNIFSAYVLKGGFQDWQSKKFPVIK